jgi:hypothetical protein
VSKQAMRRGSCPERGGECSLAYPDEAVVEEEAERAGRHGKALLEVLRDDRPYRRLRARAAAAVVVLTELGGRGVHDAGQSDHGDESGSPAEELLAAAGTRHCRPKTLSSARPCVQWTRPCERD